MDNTEATVELNWFNISVTSDYGTITTITVTHTPALSDADEWDWDTAVLVDPR